MRWTERLGRALGCAALAFVPACTLVCAGQTLSPGANLALAVTPGRLSPHGVPLVFTVTLTNITTHIVRLPTPVLNCAAIPLGTLYLRFDFRPLPPASSANSDSGCFEDFAHSRDSILQQIASWNVLLPGESLDFTWRLDRVVALPPKPGTYTLSASYVSPFIFSAERDALVLRGIDIPSSELSSPALVYTVGAPQARR